jgi:hypothetical protein
LRQHQPSLNTTLFLPTQPVVAPVAAAPGVAEAAIAKPVEVNPSDLLDKELKGLLNDISVRDEQDRAQGPDVSTYIATTNCIDIYYHTIEKRYEERKSKACMQKQAKDKIITEINKNETKLIKGTGK